ncbi:helix-turn-helix transcriptional regulator [Flavobacteriaceae bacterium GF1]
MKSKIKTYNSEDFRNEYLNASPELEQLFKKSLEDFFCFRIEDISERVRKPISPSREESHTIIFVTEGTYTTKIGFKEYTVKPDQIVIYQAGAVFSTEQINTKVNGFTCHFHPDILIGQFGNHTLLTDFEFLHVGNHPIINVTQDAKPAILNVLERLCAEFKSDDRPNPTIVHSYLYTLLAELKLLFGTNSSVNRSASFQITSQFRKLAHQNVKKNLKVADFAEMMNISPNHLNKSVKSITSKSASKINDEIKLIEIKFLLYQSGLSISEISYEMGYLDASYFTRFFKKRAKVSPTGFRKMIEKS